MTFFFEGKNVTRSWFLGLRVRWRCSHFSNSHETSSNQPRPSSHQYRCPFSLFYGVSFQIEHQTSLWLYDRWRSWSNTSSLFSAWRRTDGWFWICLPVRLLASSTRHYYAQRPTVTNYVFGNVLFDSRHLRNSMNIYIYKETCKCHGRRN